MKKLLKLLKSIPTFFYKNVYLIMVLATIYAVIARDYLILFDIAVLALISIAIELRDAKDSSKIERLIKWYEKMMDDKEKKNTEKQCDLYDNVSNCPDKKAGLDCNECSYFN